VLVERDKEGCGEDRAGSHFMANYRSRLKDADRAEADKFRPYSFLAGLRSAALFRLSNFGRRRRPSIGNRYQEISRSCAGNGAGMRPRRAGSEGNTGAVLGIIPGTGGTEWAIKSRSLRPGYFRSGRMARAIAGRIDGKSWERASSP